MGSSKHSKDKSHPFIVDDEGQPATTAKQKAEVKIQHFAKVEFADIVDHDRLCQAYLEFDPRLPLPGDNLSIDNVMSIYEYKCLRRACLCLSNLISISSRTFGV